MGYVVYNKTTLKREGWHGGDKAPPVFDAATQAVAGPNVTRDAEGDETHWDTSLADDRFDPAEDPDRMVPKAGVGFWRSPTADEVKEDYEADRAAYINSEIPMDKQIEAIREALGGDNTKLIALNVVVAEAKSRYEKPS